LCKQQQTVRSGSRIRRIRSIPVGSKPVILEMKVQRIFCKRCKVTRQENLHLVTGKRGYSNRPGWLVVELSRTGTIKDVARYLHLSWDPVKEIRKRYLYSHYNNPDITGVRHIGIGKFAVAKGQIYKMIVVDLDTGRVIYIGDGKGSQALDGFWAKVKKAGIRIENE
jgi:transposase